MAYHHHYSDQPFKFSTHCEFMFYFIFFFVRPFIRWILFHSRARKFNYSNYIFLSNFISQIGNVRVCVRTKPNKTWAYHSSFNLIKRDIARIGKNARNAENHHIPSAIYMPCAPLIYLFRVVSLCVCVFFWCVAFAGEFFLWFNAFLLISIWCPIFL